MQLLAPTVEALVLELMPWLDLEREARPLERSGAVRRTRTPSLSPFWAERIDNLNYLQKHFFSFSLEVENIPIFYDAPVSFGEGFFSINCRALRCWTDKKWVVIRQFDSLDLMVPFPLREQNRYFRARRGPAPIA